MKRIAVLTGALLALTSGIALADTITDPTLLDPLHGCWSASGSPTNCNDNGTLTPVNVNNPQFTFTASAGPLTGDFWVVALIPDNEVIGNPATQNFNVLGGTVSPKTTTFITDWMSGDLATAVGLSTSNTNPANPIGAFLPCVQTGTIANCGSTGGPFTADAGATGFDVFLADLGSNTLPKPSSPGLPDLTLSTNLPLDSYLVGFLSSTDNKGNPIWIATAPSGALYETSGNTPCLGCGQGNQVPEPSETGLLTGGVALLGFLQWRRRRQQA